MGALKRRRLLSTALLSVGGLFGVPASPAHAQGGDAGVAIGAQAPDFRLPTLPASKVGSGDSGRAVDRAANVAAGSAANSAVSAAASTAADRASGNAASGAGVQRSLAEFAGKVVWLDFWASWCGPCRQSFPWMNAMQARHGERGLRVIAVSLDRREADAQRFLEQTPAQFLVLHDAAATTPVRYGVAGMPTSVLIGRDGRVLARHSGFTPSAAARLEPLIERALDARP